MGLLDWLTTEPQNAVIVWTVVFAVFFFALRRIFEDEGRNGGQK